MSSVKKQLKSEYEKWYTYLPVKRNRNLVAVKPALEKDLLEDADVAGWSAALIMNKLEMYQNSALAGILTGFKDLVQVLVAAGINSISAGTEAVQNMLEALIRYEIVQEDEITASTESIITTESLWKLFIIVEKKLYEKEANQNKELLEVQKYVEHVRQLSEERDHLTIQFEQENEKLKMELKKLQVKAEAEAAEINDMCQQEKLEELIGSSFTEQMAYLLVVRSTLLDKLKLMEERNDIACQQCSDMEFQIKCLASTESDLRHQIDEAMSEMGGIALKLNNALKEKNALQKEVVELTQALKIIQTLPTLHQAKRKVLLDQKDLETIKGAYNEQKSNFAIELEEIKQKEESSESDLLFYIQELEKMNIKLKEGNEKLNEELKVSEENLPDQNEKKRFSDCQKLINEMQQALDEDEAINLAQQEAYKSTITELKIRINVLESKQKKLDHSCDEDIIIIQLKGQLSEVLAELESKSNQVLILQSEVHKLKQEVIAYEMAVKSKENQLFLQACMLSDVQDRNAKLEVELTKVINQLKKIHPHVQHSNCEVIQARAPNDDRVKKLKNKVKELEILLSKTSKSSANNNMLQLQAELAFLRTQIEEEKTLKCILHDKLAFLDQQKNETIQTESFMRKNLSYFQQRTMDAEAQVLLIAQQKDNEEKQKMLAQLSRTQLEDAVKMLRKRIDFYMFQLHLQTNKYKHLKQKQKTKIRQIRELFLTERRATSKEVETLERKLLVAENALKKELEWKEKAARDVIEAENGRRNAINEVECVSKIAEERSIQIKHLNFSSDHLKFENSLLQKQLILLQQQKQELEKSDESAQQSGYIQEFPQRLDNLSFSESMPCFGLAEDDHDLILKEGNGLEILTSRTDAIKEYSSYLNLSCAD